MELKPKVPFDIEEKFIIAEPASDRLFQVHKTNRR